MEILIIDNVDDGKGAWGVVDGDVIVGMVMAIEVMIVGVDVDSDGGDEKGSR
jgi:hypothetical protein